MKIISILLFCFFFVSSSYMMFGQKIIDRFLTNEADLYLDNSEKFVYTNYDSCRLFTSFAADCYYEAGDLEMYYYTLLGIVNLEKIYKNYSGYNLYSEWYSNLISSSDNIALLQYPVILNSFAVFNESQGNYGRAKMQLIKAIELIDDKELNDLLSICNSNLSSIFFIEDDFERSLYHLDKSIELLKISKNFESVQLQADLSSLLFESGLTQYKLRNFLEGDLLIQNSFDILQNLSLTKKFEDHLDVFIDLNFTLGRCDPIQKYLSRNQIDSLRNGIDSLRNFKKVIVFKYCNGDNINDEDFYNLINEIEKIETTRVREIEFLRIMSLLVKCLDRDMNLVKYNNEYLKKISAEFIEWNVEINLSKKLDVIVEKLNFDLQMEKPKLDLEILKLLLTKISLNIQSENSKVSLINKVRNVQVTSLSKSIKFDSSPDYFELLELNKSSILFTSILYQENQKIKINELLLKREQELRKYINKLLEELEDLTRGKTKSDFNNSIMIENLEFEVSIAKNEYDIIKHEIAEKYPEYNDYVLEESYFETSEIQSSLKPDEVLLETVFTDDFCLLVFFSNSEVHTVKVENENYIQLLTSLESITSGSFRTEGDGESLFELSRLFKLEESKILDGKSRLIIVPDGPLYNLPFELLKRNGKKLIEDYSISYQYSYKLLMVLKKHRESDKNKSPFLGVSFPTNEAIASSERVCDELELSKLSCAKNEIENIENILQLDNTKSDLTTDEFINESKDARIIHIASHACPDQENHQLSRIHFKDDFLTNYDISAMSLNADLAVLSACETGYGKVIEGEGAMTIARAFFQAGVNTNIVSLWKVDDCSTAELMNYFYQHLYNGEDSDVALQNAKLDFLERSHPQYHNLYYWAGFIHMGDTAPIFPKSNNAKYLLFAFIGVVAIGFGFKGYRSAKGRAA